MQKLAHSRADSLEGVIRLLYVVVAVVVDHVAAVCRRRGARTFLFLSGVRNFTFRADYVHWTNRPVVN